MRSIIVSANNSSSLWRNDAALDDFDESASEIWKKWFQNFSECSSVNEWLNMMRFVWKKIKWMMMLNDWKWKMYEMMFNL